MADGDGDGDGGGGGAELRGDAPSVPLVLHVIPTALARGAQREARGLADALDRPGERHHRVLSMFPGPAEVPVDLSLDLAGGGGGGGSVGFRPRAAWQLRAHLDRMAPEVVVAHGSEPLKYLVAAGVGRRRPLAYYAIGTYSGGASTAQIRLWRWLMGRPDLILAEGDEVRDECIGRFGVPPATVTMVPNGRDPARFHPREGAGGGDPPLVMFVGALTDGKRPDRFVEVVAALRARGLDLRAALVGDGVRRQALTPAAEAAGVDLLGARDDVADLLRGADVFVFPSRPAGEGIPGVLVEAGLSGVPTVATDVPGARLVVRDGHTGHVVPPEDLDALVEAVASLVADRATRMAMAAEARRVCEASFSLDVVAAAWESLLLPLLARAAAARGSRPPDRPA